MGGYVPKLLPEKAVVPERGQVGSVREESYWLILPGAEDYEERGKRKSESWMTILSLMALSLFLFLSCELNALFYCHSSGKREGFPPYNSMI